MNTSFHLGLIAVAGLLPPLSLAAEPAATPGAPAVAPEAKPYVLFMRTDVSVERNQQLCPIKDVSGRDFIVSVGGQKEAVPMAGGQHRIEFQHALTLARATASLTGLKSERTYSPGTDPRMVRQREAAQTNAVLGDNASLAEAQFIKNTQGGFFGDNPAAGVVRGTVGGPGGAGQGQAAAGMAASQAASAGRAAPDPSMKEKADVAFAAMNQAETMMASDLGQAAGGRLRAESDLANQLFDAVAVSFEFSSEIYLEKPYLVVITRFRAPGDAPGSARSGIFAKALEAIGSRPARIEVLHGGFPPGFEIEELQVHLYNNGREIPTEAAQKRVPLSRDEAFEYLKIDYFRSHKADTVAATPALGRPDRQEMTRLGPKLIDAAYYVKVDRNGRPGGVYADEDCSQLADEAVAALAGAVRYYPALEKGKSVEGVAHLVLSHLEL